jgi:hypothetical protein
MQRKINLTFLFLQGGSVQDNDPKKLTSGNRGHQMMQRMGWTEGTDMGL